MSGFMELWLSVGDQNLAGAIDLTDLNRFILPSVLFQTHSGVQLPAGFQFAAYLRKPTQRIQGTQNLQDDRLVTIPLLIRGISGDDVQNSWHEIEGLFTQAREASGPNGLGTNIVLWTRLMGRSYYTYYDVLDGRLTPIDAGFPGEDPIYGALCELFMLPWGRGDPVYYPSSSTYYTGRTLASTPVKLAAIPGDVNAHCQVIVVDQSTSSKFINEILLGRLSLKAGLGSTDAILVSAPTSFGSGSGNADTGAIGGTAARIVTTSSSFSGIAKLDSSAVRANNIFDVLTVAKSTLTPTIAPYNESASASLSSGYMPAGTWTFIPVPYDGGFHFGPHGPEISVETSAFDFNANVLFCEGWELSDFPTYWRPSGGGSSSYSISSVSPLSDSKSLLLSVTSSTSSIDVLRTFPAIPASKQAAVQFLYNRNSNPGTGPGVSIGHGTIISFYGDNSSFWGLAEDTGTGELYAFYPAGSSNPPAFQDMGFSLTAGVTYTIELFFDFSGQVGTMTLVVNGTVIGSVTDNIAQPGGWPKLLSLTCICGTTPLSFTQKYDNIIVADGPIFAQNPLGTARPGASITINWTNGPNASGTLMLYQFTPSDPVMPSQGWRQLDCGNVSSVTFANPYGTALNMASSPSMVDTSAPAVQLPELRAGALVQGSSAPIRWEPAVQLKIGNSEWELVNLGTITLPPSVTPDGGSYAPWELQIQVRDPGSVHGEVDIGGFFLLPHNLDQSDLDYPGHTLASLETWTGDTRRDMRTDGMLYNISTPTQIDGSFVMSGPFTLGPGDNLVQLIPLVGDGNGNAIPDVSNTAYKVQFKVTPRVKWQY